MFIFTKRFSVTPTRNHYHLQLVGITPADGRVKGVSWFGHFGPHGDPEGLLRCTAVTLVARAVAPAPFDATPDGPTCAAELSAHQPRSGSLPGDQFDQYCEVRLAAKVNDDTHKSMLSCLGSWIRGQPGARLSFTYDP